MAVEHPYRMLSWHWKRCWKLPWWRSFEQGLPNQFVQIVDSRGVLLLRHHCHLQVPELLALDLLRLQLQSRRRRHRHRRP